MPEEGKLVELVGVRKAFGDNVVLDGIDLAIGRGEAIVVAGPSGSGKSTMLRCVNGLEGIDAGSISFDGQRVDTAGCGIASLRADIGMVFQQFNLFPHMTVERNVTLAPAKVRGLSAQAARDRARELLERVGIPEKPDAYPADLSGGQQQRVAIARALAMEPHYSECLELLQNGAVDAISTDDVILTGMIIQDDSLRLVGDDLTIEPYGGGFAKGDEQFSQFLNGVLEDYKGDGRWAAAYQEWLGQYTGEKQEPPTETVEDALAGAS